MAVKKMMWDELLSQNNNLTSLISADIIQLGANVDSAFATKYSFTTTIEDLLACIRDDYLKANGLWKELPIWLSSFKEADKRFVLKVQDNLTRYLAFYTKMITDEGLQRKLVIDKGFSNEAHSQTGDKGYFSETPQIGLTNFDDAINYASNLTKNQGNADSAQSGTSYTREQEATWKEQMENLRFAFYNDLVEYIARIPNMAYSYFCLDGRPAGELQIEFRKYLIDVVENYERR